MNETLRRSRGEGEAPVCQRGGGDTAAVNSLPAPSLPSFQCLSPSPFPPSLPPLRLFPDKVCLCDLGCLQTFNTPASTVIRWGHRCALLPLAVLLLSMMCPGLAHPERQNRAGGVSVGGMDDCLECTGPSSGMKSVVSAGCITPWACGP